MYVCKKAAQRRSAFKGAALVKAKPDDVCVRVRIILKEGSVHRQYMGGSNRQINSHRCYRRQRESSESNRRSVWSQCRRDTVMPEYVSLDYEKYFCVHDI